jgi:DNA adenine methylase
VARLPAGGEAVTAAVSMPPLRAPFPYFGGKRTIAETVWRALGRPKQYIEPFCGSAAILLSAPEPASLEVIGDASGFVANFWRATVAQPEEVARWADYPVSHVDLGARHVWMMGERDRIAAKLQDPLWPGDARVAGWWLWGQCAWIGSGWCEWDGQIPHTSDAGRGVQTIGQVPHTSNAGRGVQAIGQIPRIACLDTHIQSVVESGKGDVRAVAGYEPWTSSGRVAMRWLRQLADRMERVRVVHGAWDRCLNSHYGGAETAVFLDPPYRAYEAMYGGAPVAAEAETWARENASLRVILCGHRGDYDLPGWTVHPWERDRTTYSGTGTKGEECLWLSPACLPLVERQRSLWSVP